MSEIEKMLADSGINSQSRGYKTVLKRLLEMPGLSVPELAEWCHMSRPGVRHVLNRLRTLPHGSPARVRIKSWTRDRPVQMHYPTFDVHPTKGNADKPKRVSDSERCKAYRQRNRARTSLSDHGADSRFVQGGTLGIWGPLQRL